MRVKTIDRLKALCPEPLGRAVRPAMRLGRDVRRRADMVLFRKEMRAYCPCCGLRFRSFATGGYLERPDRYNGDRYASARQDVLCPNCSSLARHRILALWCDAHRDLLRSARILYFAPERGMVLWMRRNGVACATADIGGDVDLRLDIQATGLPDESYDVVVCNHVLEHVGDFRVALRELRRILRPDGMLICSFPMDPEVELVDEDPAVRTPEARVRRFGQSDHLRVFGMRADRLLTEAGFAVERLDGSGCPEEVLAVVGPADYDAKVLFLCTKASEG